MPWMKWPVQFTDTSTIYLPREVTIFQDNLDNFLVYKIFASYQWAFVHQDLYCRQNSLSVHRGAVEKGEIKQKFIKAPAVILPAESSVKKSAEADNEERNPDPNVVGSGATVTPFKPRGGQQRVSQETIGRKNRAISVLMMNI